jgi:hypothetical protein
MKKIENGHLMEMWCCFCWLVVFYLWGNVAKILHVGYGIVDLKFNGILFFFVECCFLKIFRSLWNM